jgi:hypothetical protein
VTIELALIYILKRPINKDNFQRLHYRGTGRGLQIKSERKDNGNATV